MLQMRSMNIGGKKRHTVSTWCKVIPYKRQKKQKQKQKLHMEDAKMQQVNKARQRHRLKR